MQELSYRNGLAFIAVFHGQYHRTGFGKLDASA